MITRTEAQKERKRLRAREDRLRKAVILVDNINEGHTGLIQETRRRLRGEIITDDERLRMHGEIVTPSLPSLVIAFRREGEDREKWNARMREYKKKNGR